MAESNISEFTAEALILLDQAETLLKSLDRGQGLADPAALLAAYRSVHAVNGLAGFLALGAIQALASKAERMLDEMRIHRSQRGTARIDLLIRAIRRLREMFLGLMAESRAEGDDHKLLREFQLLTSARPARPQPRWREVIPQARRFDWHGQQINTGPPRVCIL